MFNAPLWLERETAKMAMHLSHDTTSFHRHFIGFDRVEDTASDKWIQPPSSTSVVTHNDLSFLSSHEIRYAHAAFSKMRCDDAHVLKGFCGHDLVQTLEDELLLSCPNPIRVVDQSGTETLNARWSWDGKAAEDATRSGVLPTADPLETHFGKGPWLM